MSLTAARSSSTSLTSSAMRSTARRRARCPSILSESRRAACSTRCSAGTNDTCRPIITRPSSVSPVTFRQSRGPMTARSRRSRARQGPSLSACSGTPKQTTTRPCSKPSSAQPRRCLPHGRACTDRCREPPDRRKPGLPAAGPEHGLPEARNGCGIAGIDAQTLDAKVLCPPLVIQSWKRPRRVLPGLDEAGTCQIPTTSALDDFTQPPVRHVVDESPNRVLLRNERAQIDAGDRLANVLVEIPESFDRPRRLDAGLVLDLLLELVVGEGEHSAVGVMDEDDLLCTEQPLGDRQRADLVICDDATGVADYVSIALFQAEHPVGVQPRVHAGQHRHLLARRQRQGALVERRGVGLVVAQKLVGHIHRSPPSSRTALMMTYVIRFRNLAQQHGRRALTGHAGTARALLRSRLLRGRPGRRAPRESPRTEE